MVSGKTFTMTDKLLYLYINIKLCNFLDECGKESVDIIPSTMDFNFAEC